MPIKTSNPKPGYPEDIYQFLYMVSHKNVRLIKKIFKVGLSIIYIFTEKLRIFLNGASFMGNPACLKFKINKEERKFGDTALFSFFE